MESNDKIKSWPSQAFTVNNTFISKIAFSFKLYKSA